MSTQRERTVLRRLVDRIQRDSEFARTVAADPKTTLTRFALTAAQRSAIASLALAIAAGNVPADQGLVWR